MKTLKRSLELLLDGRADQAGLEAPRMYPYDRVHLARRALDATGFELGEDPRLLAVRLGIRTAGVAPRGCGAESSTSDTVAYVWSPDRRERGLRIFHGLAHALLLRERWEHSHADAWLVTCELVAPAAELGRDDDELVRLAHAPEWLVERWATVGRRLGRRVAA